MKILIKESFDASMPQFVRDWMLERGDKFFNRPRAGAFRQVDPSTAKFINVANETVNDLRKRLKSGEIIFIYIDAPSGFDTFPLALRWNSSRDTMEVVGSGSRYFKEYSFKKYIENAREIYSTESTTDKFDKQTARQASRDGLVSRDGQSAQSSRGRYSFDGKDWKKDASGYWYDANRLANKLAKLHAEDVAYYPTRAAKTFVSMANLYADTVKEMAMDTDNLDLSTFGEGGFESITREGQRLLRDAGEVMKRIQENGKAYAMSLEDINDVRSSNSKEPISEEEFEDRQKDLIKEMQRYLVEIEEKNRELKSLVK